MKHDFSRKKKIQLGFIHNILSKNNNYMNSKENQLTDVYMIAIIVI